MLDSEFEATKHTLRCSNCGGVGLVTSYNANNNSVRPTCPGCGNNSPLVGVQWLRQDRASKRRPARLSNDPTTEEVWAANGDHCAYCGKSRSLCERLGIGLTIQHAHPVIFGGVESSPLIPFCARCQQGSVAALAETQRIQNALFGTSDLSEVIRRIEQHVDFPSPQRYKGRIIEARSQYMISENLWRPFAIVLYDEEATLRTVPINAEVGKYYELREEADRIATKLAETWIDEHGEQ